MLTGQRKPESITVRVIAALQVAAHIYPILMVGIGMTFVGLLALGPRKDIRELWICLPAGLALLGVFVGFSYWLWWRKPRLTVTRFIFSGSELVIETPGRGCFTVALGDLEPPLESQARRGLLGWWLKFKGYGAVFLDSATPNATSLVEELRTIIAK